MQIIFRVVNMLDYDFVASEFELQPRYFFHLRGFKNKQKTKKIQK